MSPTDPVRLSDETLVEIVAALSGLGVTLTPDAIADVQAGLAAPGDEMALTAAATLLVQAGLAIPGDNMGLTAGAIALVQAGLAVPGDNMGLTVGAITAAQAGLATSVALAAVKAQTDLLADTAVGGLAADMPDSIAYILEEIEEHLHSAGRWYGKNPGDALLLENGLTSWQLTAGNGGAYGNWVQLSGGDEIADPRYDPHLLMITQASAANNLYYVQLGTGAGGAQAPITTVAHLPTASLRPAPIDVQCGRVANTALLWARCACATNGATISFVLGLHTYPG